MFENPDTRRQLVNGRLENGLRDAANRRLAGCGAGARRSSRPAYPAPGAAPELVQPQRTAHTDPGTDPEALARLTRNT